MTQLIIRDAGSDAIVAQSDMDTVVLHEGNYYVSPDDVNMENLEVTERTGICSYKGLYHWIDLVKDGTRVENVAWVYHDPSPEHIMIKGRYGFYKRNFRGTLVEIVDTVEQS
jgi:uncharacterized protein (DUF427 family)